MQLANVTNGSQIKTRQNSQNPPAKTRYRNCKPFIHSRLASIDPPARGPFRRFTLSEPVNLPEHPFTSRRDSRNRRNSFFCKYLQSPPSTAPTDRQLFRRFTPPPANECPCHVAAGKKARGMKLEHLRLRAGRMMAKLRAEPFPRLSVKLQEATTDARRENILPLPPDNGPTAARGRRVGQPGRTPGRFGGQAEMLRPRRRRRLLPQRTQRSQRTAQELLRLRRRLGHKGINQGHKGRHMRFMPLSLPTANCPLPTAMPLTKVTKNGERYCYDHGDGSGTKNNQGHKERNKQFGVRQLGAAFSCRGATPFAVSRTASVSSLNQATPSPVAVRSCRRSCRRS